MLRRIVLLAASILLLPALLAAYTIVLKDGRRLEARQRYTLEAGMVRFIGTDGRGYAFPIGQVDLEATERANPRERPRPKVWTNDELELLTGRTLVSVTGAEAAPQAPAAGAEAAAAEGKMEGEAEGEAPKPALPKEQDPEYWQKRLQPLRTELAQIDQQLKQTRSGQSQAASNSINLAEGNPGVQVADTLRRLEQRRAEVQREIESIQAEARRAGVSPGYVR